MAEKITLVQDNRRIYLKNLPFALKEKAYSALGVTWDSEQRMWWCGSSKLAKAQAWIDKINNQPPPSEMEQIDQSRVLAQVEYKDRKYYVIGESGDRCLLTTLSDKPFKFWVDRALCKLIKRYEGREVWNGQRGSNNTRTVYTTIGGLKDFIKKQQDPKTRRGACTECGHYGPSGQACSECGGEGTYQ